MLIKDIHMIMYILIKYDTFLTSYESYSLNWTLTMENAINQNFPELCSNNAIVNYKLRR